MASSFEIGGLGEESEEWMDVDVALPGTVVLKGMRELWLWLYRYCGVGNGIDVII